MTAKTLEEEAREAAESSWKAQHDVLVNESWVAAHAEGYLAAAEPRERELERLRAEVASMVVQNKDLALIIRGWAQGHDHDQREIERLRAEVDRMQAMISDQADHIANNQARIRELEDEVAKLCQELRY